MLGRWNGMQTINGEIIILYNSQFRFNNIKEYIVTAGTRS